MNLAEGEQDYAGKDRMLINDAAILKWFKTETDKEISFTKGL